MSIDNAVLGTLPKRLRLTTLQNTDFMGSADTKLYLFKNFNHNHFVMYVNGCHAPSEGPSLNTATTKTCTIAYQTHFSGLGIHYGNMSIQITPVQFMKRSFMLIFDFTPDGYASDGYTSLPGNGNIHIGLKLEALPKR